MKPSKTGISKFQVLSKFPKYMHGLATNFNGEPGKHNVLYIVLVWQLPWLFLVNYLCECSNTKITVTVTPFWFLLITGFGYTMPSHSQMSTTSYICSYYIRILIDNGEFLVGF